MSKITIQLFLLLLSLKLIHPKSFDEVLSCVKEQIGKPYVKGAEGPDSFDDSGLAYYCYDKKIPRDVNDQYNGGRFCYGLPGDLVFLKRKNDESIHVGICIGNDVMIHAPGPGQVISYLHFRDNPLYSIIRIRQYWDGYDPKFVLNIVDLYFYRTKYSDLKNLNDFDAAEHFREHGSYEGRSPSLYYDPQFYAESNEDLKKGFGRNWRELYKHFIFHGIDEFRNSSPVYYGDYYRKKYPDLNNLDGNSLASHFVDIGIKEGRQASPNFDVASYIVKNPDLVIAYGNDLKQYYYHYLFYGINEGRPK